MSGELLSKLQRYAKVYGHDKVYPSQQRLAEELGVCRRTIIRWLKELVAEGLVEVKRRGTCWNRYVLIERAKAVEVSAPMSLGMSLGNVTLTKGVNYREPPQQPARKPPSVEKAYRTPAMPPMKITSSAGRVDPNPEFYRIQAILRARRGAIESARDPEAYLRAILRAELAS